MAKSYDHSAANIPIRVTHNDPGFLVHQPVPGLKMQQVLMSQPNADSIRVHNERPTPIIESELKLANETPDYSESIPSRL